MYAYESVDSTAQTPQANPSPRDDKDLCELQQQSRAERAKLRYNPYGIRKYKYEVEPSPAVAVSYEQYDSESALKKAARGCERHTDGVSLFFGGESPLSNMYRCTFTDRDAGLAWTCTEQYYQYHKALAFGDHSTARRIRAEDEPVRMKRLGAGVRGYKGNPAGKARWRRTAAVQTLTTACTFKFEQNSDLRRHLLYGTRDTIAEASPHDDFFGIRMGLLVAEAAEQTQWRGKNHMGRILMELREKMLHQ